MAASGFFGATCYRLKTGSNQSAIIERSAAGTNPYNYITSLLLLLLPCPPRTHTHTHIHTQVHEYTGTRIHSRPTSRCPPPAARTHTYTHIHTHTLVNAYTLAQYFLDHFERDPACVFCLFSRRNRLLSQMLIACNFNSPIVKLTCTVRFVHMACVLSGAADTDGGIDGGTDGGTDATDATNGTQGKKSRRQEYKYVLAS